ncbi:DCC1-like thiol-disulfide oxidoreductase family protein [bacterium]|nr:DCC1-like thiol-disulfide oxidoreductase family protein [bacterium]
MTGQAIVFFDGACAGCNFFIRWVLKADSRKRILVAPLQGKAAASLLEARTLNSIVLTVGSRRYEKSEAVLRLCSMLNWQGKMLTPLLLIPRAWRDRGYDLVAAHRYRLGVYSPRCTLLSAEENSRVLA